jgi:flagellar export protein FliJ
MSPGPRLQVVARVRGVRERDSRLGLVEALGEEREAEARVAALQDQLAGLDRFESGDLTAFANRQRNVSAITDALAAARAALASSHVLALAAREQWRVDRSRLAAVESLIDRREAERRVAQQKLEDRRLDAVAEDLWRRRNAGAEAR